MRYFDWEFGYKKGQNAGQTSESPRCYLTAAGRAGSSGENVKEDEKELRDLSKLISE